MSRTEIGQSRSETSIPRQTLSDFGTHSLSFDGSGDYVEITDDSSLDIGSNITVTAWVRQNGSFAGNLVIASKDNGSSNPQYSLDINTGSKRYLRFFGYEGTSPKGLYSSSGAINPQSKWIFVAGTFDGTNWATYINGDIDRQVVDEATLSLSGDVLSIGARERGSIFKGDIASVKIFNTALTPQQISDLYYNETVPRENLVAEYFRSIDTDGAGTVLKDTSGNGNDGTITGATWSTDVPYKPRQDVMDDRASLLFPGTSAEVSVPHDDTLNVSTDFSIFVKAKIADFSDIRRLMIKNFYFTTTTAGKQRFTIPSVVDITSAGSIVPLSKYVTLGITHSGTSYNFYIDGVLDYTTTNANNPTPNGNTLDIGWIGGGEFMKGNINNARLWNTALTPQQIYDLHFNNIIPQENIVLNLEMNEGAGSTVYDTSGNGNNGTITGATWSDDVPSPARGDVIC